MLDDRVTGLPLGLTRLVEVSRALASTPKILILDEPLSGLDRGTAAHLADALARVAHDRKIGVLLVEHDVDAVLRLAKTIYVLDFGSLIARGTPERIREDPSVKAAYLGDSVEHQTTHKRPYNRSKPHAITPKVDAPPSSAPVNKPILVVTELNVAYGEVRALTNVTFQVPEGGTMAILGVNGAGKSTLCRVASGLIPSLSGTIEAAGYDLTNMPAHTVRKRGLVYLPEGRGIFPSLSVIDNLRMGVRTLARADRQEAIDQAVEVFPNSWKTQSPIRSRSLRRRTTNALASSGPHGAPPPDNGRRTFTRTCPDRHPSDLRRT